MTENAETMKRRQYHTMTIPDWIWDWGQKEFNCVNPASELCDFLAATIVAKSNGHSQSLPPRKDRPHNVFVAGFVSTCPICHDQIQVGMQGETVTMDDHAKGNMHQRCYYRWSDER